VHSHSHASTYPANIILLAQGSHRNKHLGLSSSSKMRKLQMKKTDRVQKLLVELQAKPNTQAKKTPKNMKWFSHAPPVPTYAATGPFAITLWRMPAKLTGNLAVPLLYSSIETDCAIFISFNEISTVLYHSGFIAVSIIAVAFSSIGGRDDHETGAGQSCGQAI
jgi:hypothetical protein